MADDVMWPDSVWAVKGGGAYRIRVLEVRRDGRVAFERIAGVPDHDLRREQHCTPEQLRAAYEPTGELDFGAT